MSDNEENREGEEGEKDENEDGEQPVEEEDETVARLKEQELKFSSDIKEGISNLSEIAGGGSYGYAKLVLAEKEVERIFPVLLNYRSLRYVDLSTNSISDASLLT